jgi:hypothetical protein
MNITRKDSAILTKKSFMMKFKERFFLRFHMSLILFATGLFGLLASTLLLHLHLENIVFRYPLALLCSYCAFFLFIKIWLWYLSASRPFDGFDSVGDVVVNLPINFSGSSSSAGTPSFAGHGGMSGGGGASGIFDGSVSSVQEGATTSASSAVDSSGSLVSTAGDAVSSVFDDDTGIILVVLGVLLAVVFGSSLYLIYEAPHILSEAAFDFLLATTLIKQYHSMNKPDWVGSVFRTTYKPFLLVLLITIGAAWTIHHYLPFVVKMSDLLALF